MSNFNNPSFRNDATIVIPEYSRPIGSWWMDPETLKDFYTYARGQENRMRHSKGQAWVSGMSYDAMQATRGPA